MVNRSSPSPSHHFTGAPVDLVHLARQTAGDPALEREVLMLFRCQSRKTLARIRELRDLSERCRAAHTLKGSARGIGAWSVAQAAEALEDCRGPQIEAALSALEDAVSQTDAFIAGIVAR